MSLWLPIRIDISMLVIKPTSAPTLTGPLSKLKISVGTNELIGLVNAFEMPPAFA